MNRPHLKKQLAAPLLATAFFALACYLIFQISPLPISFDLREEPLHRYDWAARLALLAMAASVVFIVVRVLNEFVFFLFRKRKGYEAPSLMRDIFSLVAYVIGIALLLRLFFPTLSFGALLSGSALLGIILGLALQDTLGNLFAGISLHADKPFQVGDVIVVGKGTGVVESITWRAVKIRTFQNHIVLMSNSSIGKESIEVCPRDNANARIVFFSAAYSDSPSKVIHVVREAVREVDNVLRYMTPNVRVRGLGTDGVDYEVKYWLEDYARYNDTDALVRQRIWYAFRRNNLTFPFPTRTLYIQPPHADGDSAALRDGITERLSAVDIFSPLTDEELTRLARSTERHVFAPGELIIREGDQGSSMFVLHRGGVEVQITDKGRPRVVSTLREGDIFGEMALFTGEPRTANVVATEETEVLEIGHSAVKHLFDNNPDLVESLTHTIAERRAGLAAKTETKHVNEDEKAGLLASIKRFFRMD
ncbi:MAG TPA: mechanosensitive ion channel family protein [Pyrinomonadaceae bacterium]|jgi:small-conductance mechanosensitive channel/CRP-like cAMP-binding protein